MTPVNLLLHLIYCDSIVDCKLEGFVICLVLLKKYVTQTMSLKNRAFVKSCNAIE